MTTGVTCDGAASFRPRIRFVSSPSAVQPSDLHARHPKSSLIRFGGMPSVHSDSRNDSASQNSLGKQQEPVQIVIRVRQTLRTPKSEAKQSLTRTPISEAKQSLTRISSEVMSESSDSDSMSDLDLSGSESLGSHLPRQRVKILTSNPEHLVDVESPESDKSPSSSSLPRAKFLAESAEEASVKVYSGERDGIAFSPWGPHYRRQWVRVFTSGLISNASAAQRLPDEVGMLILEHLEQCNCFRFAKVCITWRHLAHNPQVYRRLDLRDVGRAVSSSGRRVVATGDAQLLAMQTLVQQPRFSRLVELDLRGLYLGSDSCHQSTFLRIVARSCPQLHSLNLDQARPRELWSDLGRTLSPAFARSLLEWWPKPAYGELIVAGYGRVYSIAPDSGNANWAHVRQIEGDE